MPEMFEPKPIRDFELEIIKSHIWKDNTGSWAAIIKWCHDHDRPFAALINTMLPAMNFCIQNYTTADEAGNPCVELNLGKLTIVNRKRMPWLRKKKS